jgi:hypothetical protein
MRVKLPGSSAFGDWGMGICSVTSPAAVGLWNMRVKLPGSDEGSAGFDATGGGAAGFAGAWGGAWNMRVNSPGSADVGGAAGFGGAPCDT